MRPRAKVRGSSVSFDERALLIEGRRELLISGEIHYPRVPAQEWERVLDLTKASGINCISTYVFWNLHELRKNCYDFREEKDLPRFLSLCRDRGLLVILRTGPYCCAEWNYGGFPSWLRDEPGVELRTWNIPYLRRVEKYLRHLFAEIQPSLATQGGPVVMVQLENEYANIAKRYKEDGDRYLSWILKLSRQQKIDVPVVMCEGGAKGALEALNGFSISEARISEFRKRRPNQPLMWTELWPGWYDTWGSEHHLRDARNIAYHLLRFVAAGGTAWNYYMWHGGTNFGRTSMYLQVHSYDFDAPLDEWGRLTRKGAYLSALHKCIAERKQVLLNGTRSDNASEVVWADQEKKVRIAWEEQSRRALLSDESGLVLFDTEEAWDQLGKTWRGSSWRLLDLCREWKWMAEPLPLTRPDPGALRATPEDQLLWTRDESDYCWYSHALTRKTPGKHDLRLPFCGDFLRIFVNGKPVARTAPPMKECRGPTHGLPGVEVPGNVNQLERSQPEYCQHFQVFLQAGPNRIDILCCALGLIKGDWMISGPMTNERKGIWSDVYLDDKPLLGWEIRSGLRGGLFNGEASSNGEAPRRPKFLGWHQATFSVSPRLLRGGHDFRLDLMGWEKGVVFINGRLLGRYWLIEADGYGSDESWQEADKHGLRIQGAGQATQRFYRIPSSWLAPRNTLELFEEGTPHTPILVRIECRRALAICSPELDALFPRSATSLPEGARGGAP